MQDALGVEVGHTLGHINRRLQHSQVIDPAVWEEECPLRQGFAERPKVTELQDDADLGMNGTATV